MKAEVGEFLEPMPQDTIARVLEFPLLEITRVRISLLLLYIT